MRPTAFASSEPLPRRSPRRPAALPAAVAARRAARGRARRRPRAGAERLGLHTVGDLLEHLPRDRGEARTVDQLVPGETATVVVEVRSITSRSVRRRGMRPLVEAVVADATGPMKATFFNQPWLERKYRPGTRLMLNGKYEGRNRFRVSSRTRRPARRSARGDEVATYPATEGLSSTQILALVREHRGELRRGARAAARARCASPSGCPTAPARSAPRTSATTRAAGARLAFEELLLLQLALLRRRARRREGARAEPLDGAAGR